MSKPYHPLHPGADYCEKHDAFYDKAQDVWLENACNDKGCDYCRNRPVRPSFVNTKLKVIS